MAALIDYTGQRFGKLTVLQRDTSRKGTYWICQCDCGNIISARRDQLTRAKYPKRSCGCDLKDKINKACVIDETGNRYGKLVVIEKAEVNNLVGAFWKCKCDCGKETIVSGVHLRLGQTQSCGCLRYESRNGIDETGNVYGDLTVLYRSYNKTDNCHIFWHCLCSCGNECDVNGANLRSGITTSCGCKRSKGETKIKELLIENNILFKQEFTFSDLTGEGGGYLRFDFAIFNTKNQLQYLIEYDGVQHFDKKCFGKSEQEFTLLKHHDQLKTEYCLKNNIPLIRIRYTQLPTLTINDLLLQKEEGDLINNE